MAVENVLGTQVLSPVLFLDEPTVKLDAKGAEAVRELVKKINGEFGTTVILTTHYIFEAEELCERVAIMHKGKIKSCDTVTNLRRHLQMYDELNIECSTVSDETMAAVSGLAFVIGCQRTENGLVIQTKGIYDKLLDVLKLLRARGISVRGVSSNEPSLEDVFVDTIAGGAK